ncbi:isochorismatase family protein [Paenibacillus arenilitoris]|uniref:Isochorismatase family protein n=1 Tax=Paenibacillus arenilitoris TaxID=2772299 RepID=A0A927CMZ4_9BACL|nr:isochorismatase family protein [Paenibacillus arenilitoris]MBD2869121.1 isochorismatase family protein [Paenibacillus arenilitoris]
MEVKIDLDFTPRSPRPGMPYTESTFVRSSSRFTIRSEEIGVALVDLWNFGWEDGPVVDSLGLELSTERGISHALRKKEIIINQITPVVRSLRQQGIQIFHCNHPQFLSHYPQWHISTTEEERSHMADVQEIYEMSRDEKTTAFPELEWQETWKSRHRDDVFNISWMNVQGHVYDRIRIPIEVEPQEGDLLIYSREQFDRLLRNKGIRVLFYMGFETDECIISSTYGIRNMHSYGYMTNIVRDCTTTYESAETVKGLWRTKVAIEQIEKLWGYSIDSSELVKSFDNS